jgi:PAS domain S-box-containing protein
MSLAGPTPSRPDPGDGPSDLAEQALAAAGVGSFDWDVTTGQLVWDQRLCGIFGLDPATATPRIETFQDLIVPEDAADVVAAMKAAVRSCGEYVAEYRIRRPDGRVRWVAARGRVLPGPDGRAARMLGLVRDSTHMRRDVAARALEHLADAFVAVDAGWRVTFVNRHAATLLGVDPEAAPGRLLWDVWPALAAAGYDRAFLAALASGEPGLVSMYVVEAERWLQLRLVPDGEGLSIFATDITVERAADLDRRRELTRPEQARRVLAYSAALAEAVTVTDVTDVVATMVLGAFDAAGMLVSLAESGKLRLVGHSGYNEHARELLDGQPIDSDSPVAQAMRTRRPLFLPSREAYLSLYPRLLALVEASEKEAWAFLPLTVSGRTLGSLTISFAEPHEFAPEERSLLASVAGLLAQTLERARLRDAERSLAAELQAQLLPRALPRPEGLVAAARYLPATEGMEVGGDWYEVLELPGQRVGVVIGDVQGHNVRAATVMGQLRNALRAYAAEGHEPIVVVQRTNRLMTDLDPTVFATCALMVVDPRAGSAQLVLAGHPPPLLRSADGSCGLLDGPVGLPLGVDPEEAYTAQTVALAPGDTLVLYTDGLVEDARRPFDVGLLAVTDILARTPVDDLERLADALVDCARGAEHRPDDIAVLVVRHDGLPAGCRPPMATMSVDRADPRAARTARDFIARQLTEWGIEELHDTTVLLVSEVVTNALRHTGGRVEIELCRLAAGVRTEVSDETSAPPVQEEQDLLSESGRGVPLMDALSDRWGTAPRGVGKVVWFELDER